MPRTRQTAVDLMPDFAGWTVGDGRFQLLDKLGSGAYGKVYRALDTTSPPENQTYYAVKCLLRHPTGSDKERLQQREINIHKLVAEHPNVVSFHGTFSDDRFVYVIMGLYTGGDLFGAITEKHLFDGQPEKIKETFLQILDAVRHCHSLGVYHRDIKPENIICSSDASRIYLADFGLSTNHTHSLEYGCGSSFYMSPECIGPSSTGMEGSPYSNRHNDIWSLGVILTNLITGRNPWRLATPTDACFKAYTDNRKFLQEVLHLTSSVNDILVDIFKFPDLERLSIAEIRDKVALLREMSVDPNKKAMKPPPQVSQPTGLPHHAKGSSNDTSYSSLGSQYRDGDYIEEANLNMTESSTLQISGELLAPPAPPTRSSTQGRASESDNSDSSGTDGSNGPITPASKAVDPKVEIPDVSEEMGGAGSALSKALDAAQSPAKTPHDASTATQVLKSAFQRFRAM